MILPDVVRPGLRVLFCGTAAGHRSAAAGAYYAHPQNKFWHTLFEVGLTPRLLTPSEFQSAPMYGLGLTDLGKHHAGMDHELPAGALNPAHARALAERFQPAFLAFTSKKAGGTFLGARAVDYGLQPVTIGVTRLFILPSPSPAAQSSWQITPWRVLAALAGAHA